MLAKKHPKWPAPNSFGAEWSLRRKVLAPKRLAPNNLRAEWSLRRKVLAPKRPRRTGRAEPAAPKRRRRIVADAPDPALTLNKRLYLCNYQR